MDCASDIKSNAFLLTCMLATKSPLRWELLKMWVRRETNNKTLECGNADENQTLCRFTAETNISNTTKNGFVPVNVYQKFMAV